MFNYHKLITIIGKWNHTFNAWKHAMVICTIESVLISHIHTHCKTNQYCNSTGTMEPLVHWRFIPNHTWSKILVSSHLWCCHTGLAPWAGLSSGVRVILWHLGWAFLPCWVIKFVIPETWLVIICFYTFMDMYEEICKWALRHDLLSEKALEKSKFSSI